MVGIFLPSLRSVSESLTGASCHGTAPGDLRVAVSTGSRHQSSAMPLGNSTGSKKRRSKRCKETSYEVSSCKYSACFWGRVWGAASGLFLVLLRALEKCLECCLLSLLEIFPLKKPKGIQEEDQHLLTAARGSSSTPWLCGGALCAMNSP